MAGRVLRPLRAITQLAQTISATNLHQRLALPGPDDEIKQLGDTVDSLLARLGDAFDAQRRFVANASHELRTPVTVVRALSQMTLSDPDATIDTFRSTCCEIVSEGENQERIIEALLVLARSEGGIDERQSIDLAQATALIVQMHQAEAARLNLNLNADLHPARIEGDSRLIDRLLANLVSNAVNHNTSGGHIDVVCGTSEGRAFIRVSNSGPVVDAGVIPRLLQPFERGPTDFARHSDGHGLGLSIVSAIAIAHDAALIPCARASGGLDIRVDFPTVRFHVPRPNKVNETQAALPE